MQGLDIYKTNDGFTVARVHYTADPVRRTEEWKRQAVVGYVGGVAGAAWRKEQEIDFTAYSGQLLCYHIIQAYRSKIIVDKYVKDSDLKYGSLDWGRNNPTSFHVYAVDEAKNVHSAYEIYLNETSIPEFSSLIKQCPYYNQLVWISADSSMWNRTQEEKDGVTSLEAKFRTEGIRLTKGSKNQEELAINELLDRWSRLDERDPGFTISPRCPKQIWEFERLRYKEITTAMIEQKNASEALVDKDNHSWDDWKYFITRYIRPAELNLGGNAPKDSPAGRVEQAMKRQNQRVF